MATYYRDVGTALELARRGYVVHGIDIAPRFVEMAPESAKDEGDT